MATTAVRPEDVFVQYRPGWRRWRVLAGLAAALVVLTVLNTARDAVSSPEAAIDAYFQALADRDAPAALRAAGGDAADGLDRTLLHSGVLATGDYLPPDDVSVREVEVQGERATATVAFTIGDQPYSASLELRRDNAGGGNLFSGWQVTNGIGQLWFSEIPAELLVNGERVWAHSPGERWSVPALFGGYRVGLPDDPLWESQEVRVVVGADPARVVELPMVVRANVRAEVEQQVVAALDACAAIAEVRPPGCPFRVPGIVGATEVDWEITRYPELGLTAAPDGFGQTQLVVGTIEAGQASVSGTQEWFSSERPFDAEVTFQVAGVVTYQDGGIVFDPDWS